MNYIDVVVWSQASVVGKRIGVHRWSPTTSKTSEGTLAFVVSIVFCAWFLRLVGYAEPFSVCLISLLQDRVSETDWWSYRLFAIRWESLLQRC